MITLSEAFRLCDIRDDETVILRREGTQAAGWHGGKHFVSSRAIRNKLDMKKVFVHKISVYQSTYDGEFVGYVFLVRGVGLSEDVLNRLEWR